MKWIVASLLIIVLIAATRRLIPRPGSAIDRYELEHWIHSFAKVKKDDSLLTICHTSSLALLRFQRTRGSGDACSLLFKVPRTSLAEARLDSLREALDQHGYNPSEPESEPGTLLECTIELPDIWAPSSGAAGARLAHVAFAALGLGPDERFNILFQGENSIRLWGRTAERWKESGGVVTRWIGRRLHRGVEEEREQEKRRR